MDKLKFFQQFGQNLPKEYKEFLHPDEKQYTESYRSLIVNYSKNMTQIYPDINFDLTKKRCEKIILRTGRKKEFCCCCYCCIFVKNDYEYFICKFITYFDQSCFDQIINFINNFFKQIVKLKNDTLSEYRNANDSLVPPKSQQNDKNNSNSKVEGSQVSSVHNLDINTNNNMISENMIKNKKRFKLEEQKELRIQEFLAARRKEYEKYITLDFDYRIVDQELRKMKPVDYSYIDNDEERRNMRKNRLHIIQDRERLLQSLSKDSIDMNGGQDSNYVQQVIQQMKVCITMLQDNFSQTDENFKNIPASYKDDHFLLGPPKFCGSALRKINDLKIINIISSIHQLDNQHLYHTQYLWNNNNQFLLL